MPKRTPKVSVCISTYGQEAFIRQCVKSVLEQVADVSLEVIVGDDASPDGTRGILQELAASDNRLKLVLRDRNIGPTANLSGLVSMATGDYIAHLDGDDFWMPGKLAAQVSAMERDEGVAACCCNARVVDLDGRELGVFNAGLPSRIDLATLLRGGNKLCHSSLLYRRDAVDAVLGIDSAYIDYRIYVRLLSHGVIAHVSDPLVGYRWRTPGSMTSALPWALIHGHLDAFREALDRGAASSDVRAAAGPFWGKVLVKAVIRRDGGMLREVAGALVAMEKLGVGRRWLALQSLLAVPRAVRSLLVRHSRSSVYFP
jgi:glycosyltransferase involved in cell wall biosynthesis